LVFSHSVEPPPHRPIPNELENSGRTEAHNIGQEPRNCATTNRREFTRIQCLNSRLLTVVSRNAPPFREWRSRTVREVSQAETKVPLDEISYQGNLLD